LNLRCVFRFGLNFSPQQTAFSFPLPPFFSFLCFFWVCCRFFPVLSQEFMSRRFSTPTLLIVFFGTWSRVVSRLFFTFFFFWFPMVLLDSLFFFSDSSTVFLSRLFFRLFLVGGIQIPHTLFLTRLCFLPLFRTHRTFSPWVLGRPAPPFRFLFL